MRSRYRRWLYPAARIETVDIPTGLCLRVIGADAAAWRRQAGRLTSAGETNGCHWFSSFPEILRNEKEGQASSLKMVELPKLTDFEIMRQMIIHVVFLLSAMALAYIDRMVAQPSHKVK